jgi:hypothetical protein
MRCWRRRVRAVGLAAGLLSVLVAGGVARAASWSPLPLYGGEVQALAVDPSNANKLIAGTWKGGIFVSKDGGAHWAPSNSGLPTSFLIGRYSHEVSSVVIDPVTTTNVYAATNDGVWKSTNGGTTWKQQSTGITDLAIHPLAIDPSAPATVYAGTVNAGVFETTNGGASWSAVNTGLTSTFITSLVINPTTPSTVYAGTGSGVGKTTNGASNWTMMNTGLPGTDISSLALDPSHPSTLYAGTVFTGVAKTTNGGTSWTNATNNLPFTNVASLLLNGGTLFAGSFPGLWKSTNGGATWTESDGGALSESWLTLARVGTSLAAGTGSGFWLSTDGGANWTGSTTGMNNLVISAVQVDPTPPPFGVNVPNAIYAQAGEFNDVYKSTSGGQFAITPGNGLPFELNPGTLQLDPGAPQTLLAGTSSGLYQTNDGGNNWSPVSLVSGTQPNIINVSNISHSAGSNGTAVVGDDHGTAYVYSLPAGTSSADRPGPSSGSAPMSPQDTQPGTITAGLSYPSAGGVTVAVARVNNDTPTIRSRDPGTNAWSSETTTGLDQTGKIAAMVFKSGIVHAAQNNRDDYLNSMNGTWTRDEDFVFLAVALADPPGALYTGTYGGGAFINTNPTGGGTATAMNSGLGNLYINALATFPGSSYLVTGTDGGGLWAIGSLPPRTSFTDPTTLSGSVHAKFSIPVKNVTTTNFVLSPTGTATKLSATLSCFNGAAAVSCATGPVTSATLQPVAPLVPGQHYTAAVNPSGATAITDLLGDPALTDSSPFRASTSEQETSLAARYAWKTVTDSNADGGSYTVEHLARASASFSFTGTGVSWITLDGPAQGEANVYIDGTLKGMFNQYAATPSYNVTHAFTGLSAGRHTITIRALGVKGSTSGTDTQVAIDAFQVGATLYATPTVKYGWQTVAAPGASGGQFAESDLAGTSVTFTFRGTAIGWYIVLGPNQGKANVYIDGTLKGTFDDYAATTKYGTAHTFTGLTDAVHTLAIRPLGTKQAASSGTLISIDRWIVT